MRQQSKGQPVAAHDLPTTAGRLGHGLPFGRILLVLLTLCLFLGISCNVGPDYSPPPTKVPEGWGELCTTSTNACSANLACWWKVFHDPVLDELIEQAVAGNVNLQAARQRILEARAQRCIAASAGWPSILATGSFDHFRISRNAFFGTGRQPGVTTAAAGQNTAGGGFGTEGNLYQVGFDATWEIDVFGKVRRSVEAASANLAAAVEDRRDILVTLLSEVAVNYVQLRGLQRQIAIAQENLASQRQTLKLTQDLLAHGRGDALAVAQAQAQVDTTAATIPPLEASLRQTVHQIGLLLGKEPMAFAGLLCTSQPIPAPPPEVPTGMPCDLLRQRPDIRRAERQLAAATANIGVAVADLYPQFSINGSVGLETLRPHLLFRPESFFWSVNPMVNWTIFDGGNILNNIQLKTDQEREAAANYCQTVLTALTNVEDALAAYTQEQAHNKALADAVASNRKTLELASQLFIQGRTDFLSVLDAQRALLAAENLLAQSDQALSADVIAIYKALGGGWQKQE